MGEREEEVSRREGGDQGKGREKTKGQPPAFFHLSGRLYSEKSISIRGRVYGGSA